MPGTTPLYGLHYPIATDPLDDAVSVIPQQLATDVESTIAALGGVAAPLAWHTVGGAGEPAFAAGWGAYGAPLRVPQYRKVGSEVILRGVVTSVTAHAALSTVFTLPVGFRPAPGQTQEPFTVVGGLADTRIDVLPSGVVQAIQAQAIGGFFSLSGIRFFID